MEAQLFEDADAFAAVAEPYVTREAALTSVIATNLAAHRDGTRGHEDALWCAVLDGGEVCGLAMLTTPFPLAVSALPGDGVAVLAAALHHRGRDLPGVNGPAGTSDAFADRWSALTGCSVAAGMQMRLYAVSAPVPPPAPPGRLRPVEPADRDLVRDWAAAFVTEAGLDPRAAIPDRILSRPGLYLWDDGGPVSLAGHTAAVAGVARLGPVFTPPEHRGRGYGAAVSAGATQAALGAGAVRVVLYTDVANPTSNGVYTRIGYCPVADVHENVFEAAAPVA